MIGNESFRQALTFEAQLNELSVLAGEAGFHVLEYMICMAMMEAGNQATRIKKQDFNRTQALRNVFATSLGRSVAAIEGMLPADPYVCDICNQER